MSSAPDPQAPQPAAPYRPPAGGFRTFVYLWASQSAVAVGSAVAFFALTIWLTQVLYPSPEQRLQLGAALSAQALAFALPTILLAPLAGALTDRKDRKRIMLVFNLLAGGLGSLLVVALISGWLRLAGMLAIVAGLAACGVFHGAALDASYAMLVPGELLPRANGMMQMMLSLSTVLSPGVAATIIALPSLARQGRLGAWLGSLLGSLPNGMALAAGLYGTLLFGAALVLAWLKVPSPKRADLLVGGRPQKSVWADVKEGALFIVRRRPLLWLLCAFALANLCFTPVGVLQPLILKVNLAPDWQARGLTYETALALLATCGGVGGVVGGLLMSTWGGLRRQRVLGVLFPMVASGVALVVFGFSSGLYLSVAAWAIAAGMLPVMNSHSQTIWQTQTPREMQGRVFSVRRVIAQCTWPLSAALAGWAGGRFNPGLVTTVLGVLLASFTVAQLFNRTLLRVEDEPNTQVRQAPTEAVKAPAGGGN